MRKAVTIIAAVQSEIELQANLVFSQEMTAVRAKSRPMGVGDGQVAGPFAYR
jgi:hypothetical protein